MPKWETDSPPMVGGNGAYSYYKNSYYQRKMIDVLKERINEVIATKLDFSYVPLASNTLHLADLGCSVGPNTFFHVHDLLESIKKKYQSQGFGSQMLEFQVFFNDQAMNDFNTLFASLPQERQYFAAGVPGELLDENSHASNKGRVHYTSAPCEVADAYASQFADDMENFLNARSEEIVTGGIMIIVTQGIPNGMPFSKLPNSVLFECLTLSLLDMVKEGLISEAEVDSFNLPFYTVSPEEMTELIERNGCFSIERMELTDPAPWLNGPVNIPEWVVHVRAAMQALFIKHFGREIVDEIFHRLIKKLTDHSHQLESKQRDKTLLFVALKRK
ncbi:loganic acid O-methyltransferase isoform X2 [Manihot esculenta]|uniref:Uncharacterized protein n=1 Tax=Manihot esculenta TaxID=3983 RepID=A0ACB7GBA1_MANES|nr:loganic acid O-methyltransferase isoform X2 [Manihot esculenta]KAG8637564.1 hypothetical protein MANES_15G135900v8 [Manihot esculenta]